MSEELADSTAHWMDLDAEDMLAAAAAARKESAEMLANGASARLVGLAAAKATQGFTKFGSAAATAIAAEAASSVLANEAMGKGAEAAKGGAAAMRAALGAGCTLHEAGYLGARVAASALAAACPASSSTLAASTLAIWRTIQERYLLSNGW